MSYLRYLSLLGHSGVQHILSCVFLHLVYPMLPVSLKYPFFLLPFWYLRILLIKVMSMHLPTNSSIKCAR